MVDFFAETSQQVSILAGQVGFGPSVAAHNSSRSPTSWPSLAAFAQPISLNRSTAPIPIIDQHCKNGARFPLIAS